MHFPGNLPAEMDNPKFCTRCTAAGKTLLTAPYHKGSNNKLCEFYKPRKKRKRDPSPAQRSVATPSSSSTTRRPWWKDTLKEEYKRWWRPHEPAVGMIHTTSTTLHRMPRRRKGLLKDIPPEQYDSWFHHRRYHYPPEDGGMRTVSRTAPLPSMKDKKNKAAAQDKPDGKPLTGRQRSKRTVPDDHVQRTWK